MRSTILLVFLCAACVKPELTRRYKTLQQSEEADDLVSLSVFVLEPESASRRLVDQLGTGTTDALLKALAAKADPNLLIDAVTRHVDEPYEHNAVIDRTRFKRRLILATAKDLGNESITPADRIAELVIKIELSNDEAHFVSWDKFATELKKVDLGSLKLERSNKFKVAATIGPKEGSTNPVKLSPEYTGERKLTEEVSLKQHYVAITGTLEPKRATIYQQGVVGIDLAGNAILDVELQVKHEPELLQVFRPRIVGSDGKWLPAAEAALYIAYLRYPDSPGAIEAASKAEYRLRSVRREDRTVVEGDDTVAYRWGGASGGGKFVLIREELMKTSCWRIGGVTKRDATADPKFYTVHVKGLGPAYFASYETADRFLTWMRNQCPHCPGAPKIGNYAFEIAGRELAQADLAKLTIDIMGLNFRRTKKTAKVDEDDRVTAEDAAR
jgi:hypothetical protein